MTSFLFYLRPLPAIISSNNTFISALFLLFNSSVFSSSLTSVRYEVTLCNPHSLAFKFCEDNEKVIKLSSKPRQLVVKLYSCTVNGINLKKKKIKKKLVVQSPEVKRCRRSLCHAAGFVRLHSSSSCRPHCCYP